MGARGWMAAAQLIGGRTMLIGGCAVLIGACTLIAGVDGDYVVGDVGSGGNGNGPSVGGNTTSSMGGNTTSSSMGGMPGTGGTGGSGGAPGVGGGVVTGGAPGVGGSGGDPGPTFQVFCDVACAVGEVCCVGQSGATNTYIGCAAPGTCPGNTYFVMTCDGQEDCAGGDICCAHRRGDKWDAIQCAANCTQNVNGERLACGGPGAPNQAVCPGTSTCLIGNDLPNFYNCSGS